MRSESFRKGVKDGIPIGLGYFAVSFTFGMMAVADGLLDGDFSFFQYQQYSMEIVAKGQLLMD